MAKKPQTREERLAAALRENLKRRKAARPAPPPKAGEPAAGDPARHAMQDGTENCAGGQSRVGVAAALPARHQK
ncbi:MAG: hypothetical protein WDN01_09820 [Rhizomicrobium sp.]